MDARTAIWAVSESLISPIKIILGSCLNILLKTLKDLAPINKTINEICQCDFLFFNDFRHTNLQIGLNQIINPQNNKLNIIRKMKYNNE